MSRVRIGIDFDNTIICYDKVFAAAASQRGLVSGEWRGSKTDLRDHLRSRPGGELAWQGLQGWVYGKGIDEAEIFPGLSDFLAACRQSKSSVYIVSHKTKFGHQDPDRTDLRVAARGRLQTAGVIGSADSALTVDDVYFEDTIAAKVDRLAMLNLDIFIDDLVEVFEQPRFPKETRSILFGSAKLAGHFGYKALATWGRHSTRGVRDMSEPEFSIDNAREIGQRLSAQRVIAITPARPGGNNRVFRLEMADGSLVALKYYPAQSADRRDRLGQEYEGLSFLARHGVKLTPRPIAGDEGENCALYEWFDGEAAVLEPRAGDADQLANFLIDLQQLREADGARNLRGASAAIYSPAEAIAQYEQRLQRLIPEVGRYPKLREFIDRQLAPSAELARSRLEARYRALGWDPAVELAQTHRALSPSDFGLHNAMRGPNGQLRFIDFEYFGWDDPVKLVCDTALHPGSGFSESGVQAPSRATVAEFYSSGPNICGPPCPTVSCFRDDLVPDHPQRIFASKPISARHGRTRRRIGGHSGRPARQGSAAPSSDLPY